MARAKSGLHRLAKKGQIPKLPNGKFDLAAVQKALKGNLEPSRSKGVRTASERPGGEQVNTRVNKRAAKPVKTPEEAAEAISLIRGILEAEGAAAGVIDFQSTRTAHLILQTRERALRLQVESGQLCNRKEIEDCIAQIARTERDRLQNWPSQVGALVASELGSDIVETIIVLEKHIRVFLTELANPEIHLKSDREAA